MLVIHEVSLIQPLPFAHLARVRATPGVRQATHATWFGGKYKDEHEGRFGIFPVEPAEWLAIYPEYVLDDAERAAWLATRTGVVVGRKTAEQFGWRVGDRIPIQGTIFRKADGGMMWEFDLVGIYEGSKQGVDETLFFVRFDYFNEAHDVEPKDTVGWLVVQVDDPADSAGVAERIDAQFANSAFETETMAEKAFVQGFANQIGNIGAILRWVLTAVFFTILLVAGNTMAQSVRERTSEIAVLKTLGFTAPTVLLLVLAESLLLSVGAGALGLALGWLAVSSGDPTDGYLPVFLVPARDLGLGLALAVALGLATGVLPAIQATRLRIVDALRRV
jgi:putative ABC transport system permease protein